MPMTTAEIAPHTIESVWQSAASYLDIDADLEAVVVIEHNGTLGFIPSGTYLTLRSAKQGLKRHAAKEYVRAAYLVTRGRGESFNIIAVA